MTYIFYFKTFQIEKYIILKYRNNLENKLR